ncbi:cob(I)yrinic acid a,c-diamide adenosyltransferase [Intestinibacter bartlettii]|uniref:Corrinoid adenosyltransferase n=1 Tax=Intestinibacter bartlettii TaxID=261299 RepID=A0ABS6DWE9_9FIRM|nr:cob(I)yrinic acid a,c-diamide adenosyltransferase [Intestinibacter bartlettii]MBU5336142.1 cob(I)yrinic acid a,c-diamide adenosyltransferase [Intestinibacter bartlettii]
MKVYTKSGDKGTTSLIGGKRIEKDSIRVEAYGTIDELNSYIGLCYHYLKEAQDKEELRKIQVKLFDVGAELSSPNYKRLKTVIKDEDVEDLEKLVDYYTSKIEKINEFIVPGTSLCSANLHIARTICRRAERKITTLSKEDEINPVILKYVNRLSDFLYILARYSEDEIIPIQF